ncbi:putative RNA methyltransferase [Prauserella muralis]|uniref:rRNA (Guanine-N1)-methyltransferase n=1 Tax=Prauserella muralis TaxID=588067 RepID=A0A2V4AZC8_9PSEU|nr:methyltransferase domain-containing protein [Prauserella muralis]PXY27127.1 rRNA (guanine-N1)-methyltransferase [Prauserella muralis]TWE23234.1 23S rRNA (guanine745-N1)-methyltransferase [Prauserella muralis]
MTSPEKSARLLPSAVLAALRCSVCGGELAVSGHAVCCERRHAFDIARQGYVNLLHAKVAAGTADTTDMVAARVEFLGAGFYAPLARLLAARAAAQSRARLVVDAGAGTGYYLAAVLDALPAASGLALDVSVPALRRAAKAHPRIGAAVWNLWHPWPVGTASADVVLNVFAPRNAAEFHRVLRPGGTLLVASPGRPHLRELASRLGLLDIGEDKQQRLDTALAGRFEAVDRDRHEETVPLPPADARRAVLMGPNAHHLHRDGLRERLDGLTGTVEVTLSFQVSVYRRLP